MCKEKKLGVTNLTRMGSNIWGKNERKFEKTLKIIYFSKLPVSRKRCKINE